MSISPHCSNPARRAEKALASVVQEAYVKGVSTRKVDDLVRALGMDRISKSEVSRICKAHDVEAFRNRPIEEEMPYVWLDATFHKVRDFDKVMSVACVVAIGSLPESSEELLERLDSLIKASAVEQRREAMGVLLRYRAFFDSFRGKLDGTWCFEDKRAAYVLLEGSPNRRRLAN